MDFDTFVEGPLLWIVFLILVIGLITRLSLFGFSIIRSSRDKKFRCAYDLTTFAHILFPLHKSFIGKPLYTILRYIFHICLFVVPIWLTGHVSLWEESRFEWEWTPIPDEWADWMTLTFLALVSYFLIRRIVLKDLRQNSSISDYCVITITALPFITGYFLSHGTLDSIKFFSANIWNIHILSGGAMLIMTAFLFCRTKLNSRKCTGCAACELSCPTGTLESNDEANLRVFTYDIYQCICCGACVRTCPEQAAELRHEISAKLFVKAFSKQEIRSVELETCERCGAFFSPEPQMNKIRLTFADDYTKFCPNCRKKNIGDLFHQLSPWTAPPPNSPR